MEAFTIKVGISSYSLANAMEKKGMSILDVIDYTSKIGGEHIEIVPLGFDLTRDSSLVEEIVSRSIEKGVAISNYAIGANFLTETSADYDAEVKRVKKEVDVANALGVKLMRHDVANRPLEETSTIQFEKDLPKIVDATREIADYANSYGITTSIENHGYYIQASERVQRIVYEVNRDNFKTTLDTGNFLCVDEDPIAGVKNNIGIASMVHLKDFYYRKAANWFHPGDGWITTKYGNYLRGAITGHGDIDIQRVISMLKEANYNGYISIEFEGLEDSIEAVQISLNNVKRLISQN